MLKKLKLCNYLGRETSTMGDCNLNCDYNASFIDIWQRQTSNEREIKQRQDKEYQEMMKSVRRKHICCVCKKYPGDQEFLFGLWQEGRFKCFDCL